MSDDMMALEIMRVLKPRRRGPAAQARTVATQAKAQAGKAPGIAFAAMSHGKKKDEDDGSQE